MNKIRGWLKTLGKLVQFPSEDDLHLHLRIPKENAIELKLLMDAFGITTYKELINWAITELEWSKGELETGRIISSLNERNLTYRHLDMEIFRKIQAVPTIATEGQIKPKFYLN